MSARLAAVAPVALILVAVVTFLVVTFGPTPYSPSSDADLSDLARVVKEPADRVVLVLWLAIAVALLWWALRRPTAASPTRLSRVARWCVAVVSVAVMVASILDRAGVTTPVGMAGLIEEAVLRAPLDVADVALGGALTALVVLSWTGRVRTRRLVSTVLLILVVAFVLAEVLQMPGAIRDWDTFRIDADELAAPAAGRVPYGNFAPQYSALLGLPLMPLLTHFPASSVAIIIGWLVLLQLVAMGVAVALPVLASSRRYLGVTALVVLAPLAATSALGFSATTYFPGVPLRVVLPLLVILGTFLLLRRRDDRRPGALPLVGLGALTGAMAINNPDFGLAAAVAVVVSVLTARWAWRDRLVGVLVLAGGAGVAAALYCGWAALAGAPVSLTYLLVFQRIFGGAGYSAIPMPAWGLHVFAASLFVAAAVIGVVLRMRATPHSWLGRQGLMLTLVGSWSLLCLPYYAGRSVSGSLIGGHGLQIGLTVASLIPLLAATYRLLRQRSAARTPLAYASVCLGLLALLWCAGNFARIYPPSSYLVSGASVPGERELDERVSTLRAVADATSTQVVEMPAITALMSGVGTQTVANNAVNLVLSRTIATLQCEQWSAGDASQVIVARATAVGLARSATCESVLDLSGATSLPGAQDWVAVPIRR